MFVCIRPEHNRKRKNPDSSKEENDDVTEPKRKKLKQELKKVVKEEAKDDGLCPACANYVEPETCDGKCLLIHYAYFYKDELLELDACCVARIKDHALKFDHEQKPCKWGKNCWQFRNVHNKVFKHNKVMNEKEMDADLAHVAAFCHVEP